MSNSTYELIIRKNYQPVVSGSFTITIIAKLEMVDSDCGVITTITLGDIKYVGAKHYKKWLKEQITNANQFTRLKIKFTSNKHVWREPKAEFEIIANGSRSKYTIRDLLFNSKMRASESWFFDFITCLNMAYYRTNQVRIIDDDGWEDYKLDEDTIVMLLLKYGS